MLFHGFPSSRFEGRALDQLARRKNLRIIAPDRPGFGLSTFQPHRRIADWPADVQALAQHIQLPEYAILAHSGGGPHALACADQLSKETVSAIGIMAMRGPRQAGTEDVPKISKFVTWLATYWPKGLGALIMGVVRALRWFSNTAYGQSRIDAVLLKNAEQAKLKNERTDQQKVRLEEEGVDTVGELRNWVLRMVFEGFAQGPEGFVDEANLLAQDWGIKFEEVPYDKIQIWHKTQDKQGPVRMVRWMVERLPHAELHEFSDDEHVNIADHSDEILSALVPEDKIRVFEKRS